MLHLKCNSKFKSEPQLSNIYSERYLCRGEGSSLKLWAIGLITEDSYVMVQTRGHT
jgi:hypothetical protein